MFSHRRPASHCMANMYFSQILDASFMPEVPAEQDSPIRRIIPMKSSDE